MKHKSKYNQNIQEELQELSPLLAKMQQSEDGFNVPDNYFDYLSASVLEQVKLEPTPIQKKEIAPSKPWYSFFWNPQFATGFAGIALLLAIAFFFRNPSNDTTQVALISIDEMESYIADNLDEFDTDLIIDETWEEELGEIQLETEEMDDYLETILDEIDDASLEQLL